MHTHTSNLEDERKQLNEQLNNALQRAEKLWEQIAQLTQDYSILNTKNKDTEFSNSKLLKEIDNLKGSISILEAKREISETRIEELTEELNKIYNSKVYRLYRIISKLWTKR